MRTILLILGTFLLFAQPNFSQITYPVRFELLGYPYTNVESCILGLPNNQTMIFWYDSTSSVIRFAKSDGDMLYWTNEDSIISIISSNQTLDINAIVLPSGRILLTYKTNYYYITYSDDNGVNWEIPTVLPVRSGIINRRKMFLSSLSLNSQNEVCFIHSFSTSLLQSDANGIYLSKSFDGIIWSSVDTIDLNGKYGSIVALNNTKDVLVYQDSTSNGKDIFFRNSTDTGINWSDRDVLLNSSLSETRPRGIKDQANKIWIYYTQDEQTPFSDIYQQDIRFISSIDEGITWSASEKLTKYVGYDLNHEVSLVNGRPIINFHSIRESYNWYRYHQIFLTYGDITIDQNTKPYMYKFESSPGDPQPGVPYNIRAYVDDDRQILSVKLDTYKNPPGIYEIIDMYDDGAHNDSLAGDHIYGVSVTLDNYGDGLSYSFIIEDDNNNVVTFTGNYIQIPFIYASDTYLMDNNNIKLPMDNRGILGDVNINNVHGGWFEESMFLYSGGMYLSGYNNGTLWANGIASASLVEDYQAGLTGTDPTDPYNKLYIVKSTDPAFGTSWQEFSHAVDQGADYYDGNNDNSYNPIDLNGNNQWDLNEDRPDFLGDVTAWCVYNDGVPGNVRRWNQQPMGIEVQQTVFSWGDNVSTATANTIFVRYRLINKGTVSTTFDSVYFGSWADPDIGESQNDIVGCDIPINLGYSYNNGSDISYGNNPPAFGIPFLQGPVNYIPGETFVDINSNGIYENGIDVPLDTADLYKGPVLGIEHLPGAKNMEFNSFIQYINGDPTMWDPSDIYEVRNYMLGRTRFGEIIDPCIWPYGAVMGGVDCLTVNPRFMYSGNPETLFGWLNITSGDQRMLVNTGPFTLKINQPIDIIVGYVIGRGTNSVNSVTILKSNVQVAKQIYESNFVNIPVGVDNIDSPLSEFRLNQNFPNPFNPSTIISWQSPVSGYQTLKVYDVLGNEVATLVNEYRNAGSYEVDFNASKLSSGVYFYQLKAGEYLQTRKMVLIK